MKKIITLAILLVLYKASAQMTIPGDSLVYGPMFSPVYENKVRVWMLTKENTGSGNTLALSMTSTASPDVPLQGMIYNSDDRHLVYNGFETGDLDSEAITREEDYRLRSYEFDIAPGETYTAKLLENGSESGREATIKAEQDIIDDFTFLSGGCGRIFDLSRCIDQWESERIINGDPKMYNDLMAKQDSDLMVWLGDAVYLLGEEHAHGGCPDSFLSDWDNEEQAFKRYMWYRKYYDELLQSMPQLAITDNHDTGSNEFDKTLPGLPATRKIFKDWWPNPEYLDTEEGEGLFSSYRYKDVEFFLTDNRSYRNNTKDQLGDEQLEWLQQELLKSTATFKIIISGTPTFREMGGRNLSSSKRGPLLLKFINDNKIDGVLSYSADLHQQRFMLRENESPYPMIDVVSGNLNSDAPETDERYANYNIDLASEHDLLKGSLHAFIRTSVYGDEDDRRLKIEYVNGRNEVFFSEVVHEGTLTSNDQDAQALNLSFDTGGAKDASAFHQEVKTSRVKYGKRENGRTAVFTKKSSMHITADMHMDFNDKSFTVSMAVKPKNLTAPQTLLSNRADQAGVSIGLSPKGKPTFINHKTGKTYSPELAVNAGEMSTIVWRYDNLRQQLKLYINGDLARQWEDVPAPGASTADLQIANDTGGNQFIGEIDYLRVYNKLINE